MEHRSPGAPAAGPERQRSRVPSAKPALVVVGIAALLVLLLGIGGVLSGSGTPTAGKPPGTPVKGTTLRAESATHPLHPIERPGTPPADVLGSLVLPVGSATLSSKPWDGATQFSGTMTFRLASSQESVVDFYRAELRARGWSKPDVGPAHGKKGATEVLAQRASSDGWYWEVGVVVWPTTFSHSSGTETTRFTLDLFQEPETG